MIGGRECCNGCRSFNKRLGAENVNIVYRRSLEELPARIEEYHHSLEEGINYYWLTNPIAYLDDQQGNLAGVECVKNGF